MSIGGPHEVLPSHGLGHELRPREQPALRLACCSRVSVRVTPGRDERWTVNSHADRVLASDRVRVASPRPVEVHRSLDLVE